MEEWYEIFEYHYVDKDSGLGAMILARTEETAQAMIDIMNIESCCYWIPRKSKFKVKKYVNRPPYELEQEQLEATQEELERRRAIRAKREKEGN